MLVSETFFKSILTLFLAHSLKMMMMMMVVGNYYVNALLHQWKLFLRTHDVCRKKLSDSFDESFQSVTEVKQIGCELDVYGLTL